MRMHVLSAPAIAGEGDHLAKQDGGGGPAVPLLFRRRSFVDSARPLHHPALAALAADGPPPPLRYATRREDEKRPGHALPRRRPGRSFDTPSASRPRRFPSRECPVLLAGDGRIAQRAAARSNKGVVIAAKMWNEFAVPCQIFWCGTTAGRPPSWRLCHQGIENNTKSELPTKTISLSAFTALSWPLIVHDSRRSKN